jgi:two-component system chemotaxis sensor kinase CheA
MPRLDGLDLTRRIRADERTAGLPIIAVTSLASDEDFARGKAVGVNEYQTKLDRDNLLAGLQRLMTADATIELVPA